MVAFMADKSKSMPKASGTTKKSTSSPSVRTLAELENGDISPADKKRSKLGYHRTAVACGHCRRRKIRCIPAPDTSSTRCQNCIRLKKDCQFYPVDQNSTPQAKRNRSDSKGDALNAGSETSVSSSSPKIQAGVPIIDQYEHFRSPIETVPISQGPDQEYSHGYDHRPWYSNEHTQHPYWLQHDSNHSNSFAPSPYPMTPTTTGPQPMTSQEHAYTYPAVTLEHQPYQFSAPRSRNGPISPHNGIVTPFGGFRANTMPDRIAMLDETQRNHDLHQHNINMPPQHMMGPPFQPMNKSPSQYPPPISHQVWLPSTSESQHHQASYIPQGPPSAWYNHADTIGAREENGSHSNNQTPISQETNGFRHNPG